MYLVHFHQGSVCHISKVSFERKIMIKKKTSNEDETGRKAESGICINTFKLQLIRNPGILRCMIDINRNTILPLPHSLKHIISRNEKNSKIYLPKIKMVCVSSYPLSMSGYDGRLLPEYPCYWGQRNLGLTGCPFLSCWVTCLPTIFFFHE